MTAPLPPDPADVLTRLEELHTAATPGEWKVGRGGEIEAGEYGIVICRGDVNCMAYCYGGTSTIEGDNLPADAAAIVAEHNATPALLAAVRGVLALHVSDGYAVDPECRGCRAECLYCEGDHPWPCPTVTAITAALEGAR